MNLCLTNADEEWYEMFMQTFVAVFKTLGFPVAVCAVLLYFSFVTLAANTSAIRNLDNTLTKLVVLIETSDVFVQE